MPLLTRVKSNKLPNEGWFETAKLLKLINESLLLMGIAAKHAPHSQGHSVIDTWLKSTITQVTAHFTPLFGRHIGALAKKVRSGKTGWIDFCAEDWLVLKKIIIPAATDNSITAQEREHIVNFLHTIKNHAANDCDFPHPNELMALGIQELLFNGQLHQFTLLYENEELNKAAKQLISDLSQVIALEATPLAILKLDEKYYSFCKRRHGFAEIALQIAASLTHFSESSNDLACIKQGHHSLEKQGLIVTHLASQLITEFNLKTSEQSLKTVKHKLASQRKNLQQKTERITAMQNLLNHAQGENELIKQQLKIEGELLEALREQFVSKNASIVQLKARIQQLRGETAALKKDAKRLQTHLDKERCSTQQVIPFTKSHSSLKR